MLYDATQSLWVKSDLLGIKNTWRDWHLMPSEQIEIAPPKISYDYAEIPGRELGPIDMTEYLNGPNQPGLGNREGSITFYLEDEYKDTSHSLYHLQLMALVQSNRVEAWTGKAPGYVYHGRISVESFRHEKSWTTVVLKYVFDPWIYDENGEVLAL